MNRTTLARQATRAALQMRQRYGLKLEWAISPYDLAQRMGVSVRFAALPSLEGIYESGQKPVVLLSSLRPAGRQAFTCAHEIGHHVFGHGSRIDEILQRDDEEAFVPDEYLAHRFASALLMPKIAVEAAFARRGWQASEPAPEKVFVVAQDLGVGYTTLLGHLHHTLHLLPRAIASALERAPLKRIRRAIAGFDSPHDLFVVDRNWGLRPVEVEIGDVLLVPSSTESRGVAVMQAATPRGHLVAVSPGEALLVHQSEAWTIWIRVRRRDYEGLARYRHMEDPDYAA